MKSIYFVNDTSDNPNWGCRATTAALRSMIAETGAQISNVLYLQPMSKSVRFLHRRRMAEAERWLSRMHVLPLGGTISAIAKHRLGAKWDQWAKSGDVIPDRLDQFDEMAKAVMRGDYLVEQRDAIQACDVVFVNGEGSIYDHQRKGRMILFFAYIAKVHFNKPVVIANHTAELGDARTAEMAAHVYPMCDDIVFREPISARQCSHFMPNSLDYVAADAAFNYEPTPIAQWSDAASKTNYFGVWPDSAELFDPSQPYICVAGSSIYLRPDRPAYDPIPAMIDLCRRLEEQVGQVVLCGPCGVDLNILRAVAEETGLPLISLHTPTQQAVDILGNALALISGRWHPSILATTGGTPIVTFSANSHKIQGLVEQFGLEATTFDALALHRHVTDIVDLCRQYVDQGQSLRDRIRHRAVELRERSARNVQFLLGDLDTDDTSVHAHP